ncbi:hypothetical protein G1H11_10605 [Phytoactinopolyspora alkaliphila]|uniref:Uncharacterized protein n=1 Tax=Phytoactinopolyspora alkaliphila TaxID=1783498 RepID=A0A6N9YL96_9ACTN|nr:hypothetical protein [Phytoactinopolyspora alkaliphila]NED95763.1 hypothetical protein [Phytoactinopolyspora alkaliphila]
MGRWARSHRDDAAATHGSGTDDVPVYSPMHLNADDPVYELSGDDASDNRPWRQWLGLGLALVVGAVAGVIGANARHDAAEQGRIELVAGRVVDVELASSLDPRAPIWRADLMIFNAGSTPVDVLYVDVNAWRRPDDGRQPDPVTARPGTWASLQVRMTPDCTADAPAGTASHVSARAHVRGASAEATVPLEFGPDQGWFRQAWTTTCAMGEPEYPDIFVAEAEVLPRDAGDSVLHTRLHLYASYPLPPRADRSAALLRIRIHTDGLTAATGGLPVTLDAEESVAIDIGWEISDCREIEHFDGAALHFHVAPDAAATGTRVQNVPLPASILVALGRLSADVCGL